MAWMLIGLYLLWITPIRAGVLLRLGEGRLPQAVAGLMIWGVGMQGQAALQRDAAGTPRLEAEWQGKRLTASQGLGKPTLGVARSVRAIGKANWGRMLLKRAVRLQLLEGSVALGGEDAALIALLTGGLRAASGLLPRTRIRAVPRVGGKSALRLRVILEARLGPLLCAGALGAASYLRAR